MSPATRHQYSNGTCTLCGAKDPSATKIGDLNGDGRINTADYVLLKRSVLGTYQLNEKQKQAADINHDGRINTADYVLLKRHVLGTYRIP